MTRSGQRSQRAARAAQSWSCLSSPIRRSRAAADFAAARESWRNEQQEMAITLSYRSWPPLLSKAFPGNIFSTTEY